MVKVVALDAALVGGVCLVAHLFVDVALLTAVGLVLVGVAVLVVGAGLARARWLTLVTGAGAVALAWAVLEMARELAPDRDVEAVVGGLATLCVAIAVLRPGPGSPGSPAGPAGRPAGTRAGNHRT